MSFIHEMTHYDKVKTAVDERTDDIASGSYKYFRLDDDQKTVNAQNYGWFAGEAYWSRKFNMEFTDPTPNVCRRRAVPVSTTERTVGEDEAPQANFQETSLTFSTIPACYGGGSDPFTQGDAASAIDDFCSSDGFQDFVVVPKVSLGNGTTSSGQTKALDVKDFAKVGNGETTLWIDIAFAESNCSGTAAFNKTDCSIQLKTILNDCDTGGDYPKYGGWNQSSREGCLVYRPISQKVDGLDPMYVQANDGEMGDWTCQDTPGAGTCTCFYELQSTVTDIFNKPTTSGGCADVKEGTPPKND